MRIMPPSPRRKYRRIARSLMTVHIVRSRSILRHGPQVVSGTNPVNYLLSDVKASDGGDAARFKEEEKKGTITVYGGTINVFPAAVKVLPNGRYTVSLKVYNEGHTKILTDICTFIIQEEE